MIIHVGSPLLSHIAISHLLYHLCIFIDLPVIKQSRGRPLKRRKVVQKMLDGIEGKHK